MPIFHTKGVISNCGDFFYYSGHWQAWSRLLFRGGNKVGFKNEIAISLTSKDNFEKSAGRFFVKSEYIRIYHTAKKHADDIYTHVLPELVFEDMCYNLGFDMAARLIDYDYLSEINLTLLDDYTRIKSFSELKQR